MITQKKIKIKSLDSYNKLLDVVNSEFIDKSVVEFLRVGLGIKCKEILIEDPYYDRDYLSSYYIYYVKKHKEFSKKCVRLIFLSQNEQYPIIGYMTLRPTYTGTHIGRIFASPYSLFEEEAYFILSKTKVHFFGGEEQIDIFPQIGQECDASVCAHVSSWSVLRHFSNRFHKYPEIALGELFDLRGDIHAPRVLLSSGLTPIQIADLFAQNGFSPRILYEEIGSRIHYNITNIRDEILVYIESGIPVIGVVEKSQHAIAIVGRGRERRELIDNLDKVDFYEYINGNKIDAVMSTHFIDTLFVNDDHYFPYQEIDVVSKLNPRFSQYTFEDIKCAIVPLYPRINLVYSYVKSKFLVFFRETGEKYGWDKPSIIKIYLASANTYKQYLMDVCRESPGSLDENLVTIIEALELPRFVWCIELSSLDSYKNGLVDHIVMMDSTASTVDPNPFIMLTAKKKIYYIDGKDSICTDTECDKLRIRGFSKNLELINKK